MSRRLIHPDRTANQFLVNNVSRILGSLMSCSTSTTATKKKVPSRMKSWQIYQYGDNEELTQSTTTKVPSIHSHKDILVEVYAASVNPIDTLMRSGYGHKLLNAMRRGLGTSTAPPEFPRVLGRDFSGTVIATGHGVSRFKPGDQVWGAIDGHRQGTHAQFTVAGEQEISHKPESVSHVEAASIPYVAATTWMALHTTGGLTEKTSANKRVLILAGSGGIGSFAIQLAKGFGADVTSTCSTDAVGLVKSLGADTVLDYKTSNVANELKKLENHLIPVSAISVDADETALHCLFDVVLDAAGGIDTFNNYSWDVLKTWSNAKYITLKTPLLGATDKYGLPVGVVMAGSDLGINLFKGLREGRNYRWALFRPNGFALDRVAKMVDSQKIRPVIDKVYPFDQLPEAFQKVEQKHGRGKTVIDMTS